MPEFDQIKSELKKRIERDSRSQKTRDVVIDRLKSEWGFVENKKAKDVFYKIINDDFFNGEDILKKIHNDGHVMFVFNSSQDGSQRYVFQKDFANYLVSYRDRFSQKIDINTMISQLYKTFKEQKVLDIEMNNLEIKYDDFRLLIDEYHDGILLFNLSEEKVWNKAIQDTLGLLNFYNQNQNNYMWSERVSAQIYSAKDDKIKQRVINYLKRAGDKDKLLERMNKNSALNLSVEEGVFEKGDNDIIDNHIFSLEWNDSFDTNDFFVIENSNQIIVILDLFLPSVKALDQIKGIVISDYQALLENNWLKELKSKYDIQINQNLLSLAKRNQLGLLDIPNDINHDQFDCISFSSCFSQTVKLFGASSDVFFGWNGQIYNTEIKPLIGDDE